MRRTIGLIVLSSVSLLLLMSMFWALSAFGGAPVRPDWQGPVERYLSSLSAGKSLRYAIVSSTKAAKPWTMNAASGGLTYGKGYPFSTEHSYGDTTEGSVPLPYPPIEVWCVEYAGGGTKGLAIVAEHQALYYLDWVVHEMNVDPTSDAGAALLKKVGCD